jgi:hypothetical protein
VTGLAAERRKICSPRREPWVISMIERLAAERRNTTDNDNDVSPLRGWVGPAGRESHGLRHGLQIYRRSAAEFSRQRALDLSRVPRRC